MKALQQRLAKLESNDTQVLGISMDSPFSNFDELPSAESEELRLPIPEDPHLV
jgi:peroxiredoxin